MARLPQPFNLNALFWAIGNGLASSTLFFYLLKDLGSSGLLLGFLLGVPRLFGLVRLVVPAVLRVWPKQKVVTLSFYISSAAILGIVPIGFRGGLFTEGLSGQLLLCAVWTVHRLLEFMGTVVLWNWMGHFLREEDRSQQLGLRERYMGVGRIVGLFCGAVITLGLPKIEFLSLTSEGASLVSIGCGLFFLGCAFSSLLFLEEIKSVAPNRDKEGLWYRYRFVLSKRLFVWLLVFGTLFSLVNGFTVVAIGQYGKEVLGLTLGFVLGVRGLMHAGQSLGAPWIGKMQDRHGVFIVVFWSQLLVASGLFFYGAASQEIWWLVLGAWG
ncbi:MAG: hypothetical protein MPJ24_11150, partial [Pirellulaceae bacterium]|nr:hypothetical protein [Pirellulaceae bacterium]